MDGVDVWMASTDGGPARDSGPDHSVEVVLSPAELDRAAAMPSAERARRWRGARAITRRVLAAATGLDAAALRIDTAATGKPFLRGTGPEGSIEWSLSHSGPYVAVAVAQSPARPVGVDIEVVRARTRFDALCERVLSAREQQQVRRAVDPLTAFLQCWVQKEAILKATGDGLRHDLRSVLSGYCNAGATWTAQTFDAGPGLVGAVAAPGEGWRVRVHWLDPGPLGAVAADRP